MIRKIKKLILNKLDYLFTQETNRYKKYNTCLYKITSYLNHGSQGKIYKGFNRITHTDIIIKVIKKSNYNHCDFIKNEFIFYNLHLYHKNIIRYKNIFLKNKNCHIIMDYYPQDLYYYYAEQKYTLKETEIKIIIKQIVNGLYFLSKHNIYHGDIKLENIMLTKKNDITNLKLIDFTNYIIIPKNKNYSIIPLDEYGTISYLAPELLIGKFYKNSDVWSIGVLIYLLLTDKIIQNEYTILKQTQQTIDKELQKIENYETSFNFKNLIYSLLQVNPQIRLTLKELKNHPWFYENDENNEIINKEIINEEIINKEIINKEIINEKDI